jgi:hypothetical protein
MAFIRKKKTTTTYSDPESLFRDRRNRTIPGPLSHQSDILRRYQAEAFDKENVALELPTGSGKTLVGLLIAEFRRVTLGERVLYLCPTKQLTLQVCEQSIKKYGIEATPFIGKIRNYDPSDKRKYQTGQTIAVAPYSALFNTNPFFDKSQLIILDDAHASENYIASNWSLLVNRIKEKYVYFGLLDIIKDYLPLSQQQRFLSDERDDCGIKWIEKIPTIKHVESIPDITAFLDENTKQTDLQYPWSLLDGHLEACHIYVSYDQILIRPYIPPSLTHPAFAYATQRVFMSATLGLGGDLERITGIPSFHRLPIPKGWDKQGIGRRYFVFPELNLPKEEIAPLIKEMVDQAGRGLILVTSEKQTEKYHDLFDDIDIYNASAIESSKDGFISNDKAIALLANRYDGIDLLEEECRLLIIEGLPKAGNLQELYLMSRMVAGNLFKDRIRTRIIQAFGRCTRSATDYAAVVVIGEDFFDWLILEENRSLFHPELQGELIFGAEQAEGMTNASALENLNIFLEHGKDWNEVDKDILEYRDEVTQLPIPGQDALFSAACTEVKYSYSMWNHDYERCTDLAQQVASVLTGDDLKGLRGFWHYLAGAASQLAHKQLNNEAYRIKAEELYSRASACLPAVTWLRSSMTSPKSGIKEEPSSDDILLDTNVERIEMLFDSRSFSLAHNFEIIAKKILEGLDSDNSEIFEEAHRLLGELLGFEAGNSSGHATPDPWWISNSTLCLVSEDKSDSRPDHAVPVKHVRQAASHAKWIRDNIALKDDAEIHTVMITTQAKIHRDVPTYAENVGWWHIDNFRKWALNAINVLRRIRSTYAGPGQESWRVMAREQLLRNNLDPRSIAGRATEILLRDVENE